MKRFRWVVFLLFLTFSFLSEVNSAEPLAKLSDQLNVVRSKRLNIEKSLMEQDDQKNATKAQQKHLKTLQSLQVQEKRLTQKRLEELQAYLKELGLRKADVLKRIRDEQFSLKVKISRLIHPILYRQDQWIRGGQDEAVSQLKRHIFSQVVLSELKELESMNADLQDAEQIEAKIVYEQAQMTALLQDLKEQENVLEFHQRVREAQTIESKADRLKQLADYKNLRNSEIEIERMISQFQARQDQEKATDQSKAKSRLAKISIRPRSLIWPLNGKVKVAFGSRRDENTGLMIFNKGIEVVTHDSRPAVVKSVLDGILQFRGEIPGKAGIVWIIEHPGDLYTIYGGLESENTGKVGDSIPAETILGQVSDGRSLYFEIRSRNLAIDPLKWLQ
jgi:murein DD-endopeptidase MepM/ murein hydrolase activator NlpD